MIMVQLSAIYKGYKIELKIIQLYHKSNTYPIIMGIILSTCTKLSLMTLKELQNKKTDQK